MDREAIRVLFEPGYDYGRFGVWMLDLPGCFVWADDRESALRKVPDRVATFAAWLARHERVAPVETGGEVVVLEEVPARWVDDEEINVTFEADRTPLTGAELAAGLTRLEDAHADFTNLLDELGVSDGGAEVARRNRQRDRDRPAASVARHVGGAEIWMVGRLDRALRYEGPGLASDLDAYLGATHRWAVDELGRLHSQDAAVETSDRRGETWTIRKVLRRLIYHSLDHLAELERDAASGRRQTLEPSQAGQSPR